jgi:N-acetyltransferase
VFRGTIESCRYTSRLQSPLDPVLRLFDSCNNTNVYPDIIMNLANPPPQLSKTQLDAYLKYIGLPQLIDLPASAPRDLQLLTLFHVHQISSVPYENLTLHYSDSNHTVDINPHVVLDKILTNRGRGGYCMEVSVLVKYVVEALGFNVYWTGVRIRMREAGVPFGDFIGL